MENQPTIQQRLNAIVYMELKELRDTMDFLNCHVVNFDEENAPMINLKSDEGFYVNWVVRKVVWNKADTIDLNCHLSDCPYRPDEKDDQCNAWFNYDADNFRGHLVPGEITELTHRIDEHENPSSPHKISDEQSKAIENFISAYKKLQESNIGILYDMENEKAYFYNGMDVNSVDIDGTGKEVKMDRLRCADFAIFRFVWSEDTLTYETNK